MKTHILSFLPFFFFFLFPLVWGHMSFAFGHLLQIDLLPPSISYSPLTLPFLGPSSHISDPIVEDDTESESGYTQIPPNSILRRDLFDARFQLMNEDDDEHNDNRQDGADEKDNQQYVDSDTDLIPGTYEGGLKTWEGGVDLVQVLNEMDQRIDGGITKGLKGKKVLEVCVIWFPSGVQGQWHVECSLGFLTPNPLL